MKNPVRCVGAPLAASMLLGAIALIGCGTETPSGPGDPPDDGVPPENAPTQLAFLVQPGPGDRDVPLATIEVAIQDADGNTVSTTTDAVTLALADNPGGAALGGTTTVDAVDGVAAFTDVTIDATGSGYTLEATSGDLTSATSDPFDVIFAFQQVTAGQDHSCGVRANGDAYCWGSNAGGKLGVGPLDTTLSTMPMPVMASVPLVAVAAGMNHTCGLSSDGTAFCWGNNDVGQLGDGIDVTRDVPAPVSGDHVFTAITVGADHSCGLTAAGAAYCWGAGDAGQRGDSTTTLAALEPVEVTGGLAFASLEAGGFHTCAVAIDEGAYCWGNNGTDQLGDGSGANQSAPVAVQGGLAFTTLASGGVHSCGLTTAAEAHCWGFNFFGQLGDGSTTQRPEPTPVDGGFAFAAVAAGTDHTCGVTTAGDAYCWGLGDSGRLGNGDTADSPTPVAVLGGESFSAIAAGGVHTCAIAATGAAYCWGANTSGQLGDGGVDAQPMPVPVLEP